MLGTWTQLLLLLPAALAARLPGTVVPEGYRIFLRPDFEAGCSFSGRVDITLTALSDTNDIILHSKHLKIDEESISFLELSRQPETDSTRMPRDGIDNITISEGQGESKHLLRIGLPQTLQKGGRYVLSIAYNGTMNKAKSVGIYCRQYKHGNQTRWLMSASFEPYLARSAFPCFDEPGFKANFSLKLGHPTDYIAISNMPAVGVQPLEDQDGWSVTEFETTPPMSTYLVGFLVSQYPSRSVKLSDGRPLTVWASSEQKLQAADLALLYGRKHQQFFSEYFQLKDPMPKIDFLGIRHYQAGGLENWGIISFEERLIILDSASRSRRGNRLRASSLIAHELVHIWFGNLVTPKYWDDIWLSEGFSSYFATVATDNMFPTNSYDIQSFVQSRLAAMSADSLPTTHPLKVDAASHPTGDLFDEITYHKGELIVRMLSMMFGEDKLKSALQEYLEEHKYGLASDTDIWNTLENKLAPGSLPEGVSLAEVMKTWTGKAGYPVLIVTRNYTTGQVTVSQMSILDRDDGGWWIPVSYTDAKQRNYTAVPRFWLSPKAMNYTFNTSATANDWILFNTRAAGYYSARYDMTNSLLLAEDLDRLPLLERIQVLGDILQLGYLGQTPIELSLDLVLHFKAELSPFPWFPLLEYVPKYMALFRGTEGEQGFVNFFQGVLGNEFNKLTKDSPHNKQMFKVSCRIGVKNCTEMALSMFEEWKTNSSKVPEELRYSVLCTAVENGNASTWQYLEEKYQNLKDGCKEKKDILKALACTTDKKLSNKYLHWALETKTSKKGTKKSDTMLKAIAERDPSLLLSTFVKESSLPRISKSMRWKRILEKVALNVYNEEQLNQLKNLVEESREKLKSADYHERNKIVDIAVRNVEWVKGSQKKAVEWFSRIKRNQKA
ncbi:aminopeptidase N [Halyomorpha halys]|uniref:aminopeptidase N n=1 Tax=Halyomorpha halys TaxID=286706 RepID=UPI0006D5104E|nr:aminopeptidase N [Halyomorpha halys]